VGGNGGGKSGSAWLVEGIRNGTVVAVADGSYDRKTAPDVSGAGLVLCCTNAEKMLRVRFFERSRSASSYRGELLGLVALRLLLLAMCQSYEISLSSKLATVVVVSRLEHLRLTFSGSFGLSLLTMPT